MMTFDVKDAQARIDAKLAAAVARKLDVHADCVRLLRHRPIRGGGSMTEPVFAVPADRVSQARALGLIVEAAQ
jgi:hypothetical protein